MNKTFSLEQISKTGNLDAKLIYRQYKLDLVARYLKTKSVNPKLEQNQVAKNEVTQVVLYINIEMIKICYHLIEFHLVVMKENKRFHKESSMTI